MLIAGAGGHAKDLLAILLKSIPVEELCFFDATSNKSLFMDSFPLIQSEAQLLSWFQLRPEFILGVGHPRLRKQFFSQLLTLGGIPQNIIAPSASIGVQSVQLGIGLNIMEQAVITTEVEIGDGVLINAGASVHHETRIGEFSEISPGARILGKAQVGKYCRIGAGAILLPGITIGDEAVVGAGAVVTKNVDKGAIVKGVPAK